MTLQQAIEIIDSGAVFSCTVVGWDKQRNKKGEKKFYPELKFKKTGKTSTEIRETNARRRPRTNGDTYPRRCTVMAAGLPTSSYKTIHLLFLLELNGQKVML